jgi:hypothetical protein
MKRLLVIALFLLWSCKDPAIELPPAPFDLAATSDSTTEIKLTWSDASEFGAGFRIYRKAGIGEFGHLSSVPFDQHNYTDTGLEQGASYTYRVSYVDMNGAESLPSNEIIISSLKVPVLSTFAIPEKNYGDPSFTIQGPSSTSPVPIVFISSDTQVAAIEGNKVTILAGGSSVITAYQGPGNGYTAASADATLIVRPIAPALTDFKVLEDFTYVPNSFAKPIIPPKSTSQGHFTFTSSDESIARVVMTQCGLGCVAPSLLLLKAGTVEITADQAATPSYTAGSISSTITIIE